METAREALPVPEPRDRAPGWELGVNFTPYIAPKQKGRFAELPKTDIDYWARGNTADGTDTVQKLSVSEKKALRSALRSKLREKPTPAGRLRVVTGVQPILKTFTEVNRFDIDEVRAYGTCSIETIEGHMASADVAFFLNQLGPWQADIRSSTIFVHSWRREADFGSAIPDRRANIAGW